MSDWRLQHRIIGPTKTVWHFGGDRTATLTFDYESRRYSSDPPFIVNDELLPLLSREERATAVAAAINPPTDRSLTKLYFNWKPSTKEEL